MISTTRGGTFWGFVFGVAFGAAIGAVLMHKYVSEHPGSLPAGGTESRSGTSPSDEVHRAEDAVERALRQWHLTPDDIRNQLARAGHTIKREGGAVAEKLDEATLDARIVASVETKYTLDAHLSAWAIKVTSSRGHVTLAGTVDTEDLAVRAVVLALDTRGVVDVNSALRVKPTPPSGH